MMQFKDNTSIYVQIKEYLCERILLQEYAEGERIPSVRELGVLLQVNPNTVLRGYELLQNEEIIYNKRGVGYFVAQDGVAKIKKVKKEDFVKQTLPHLFKNMMLLDIDFDEINLRYQQFKQDNKQDNNHENKS